MNETVLSSNRITSARLTTERIHRQAAISRLLARHARIVSDGHYIGCLCGEVRSRIDHFKHLAELIDELVECG